MRREHVGSILVTDESGAPLGIFTLRDLRDRVAGVESAFLEGPITQVIPCTCSGAAGSPGTAFEAASQ